MMTNRQKFIEIMNETFDAGFTEDNFAVPNSKCSPCGYYKKREFACDNYECDKCRGWWDKEYKGVD